MNPNFSSSVGLIAVGRDLAFEDQPEKYEGVLVFGATQNTAVVDLSYLAGELMIIETSEDFTTYFRPGQSVAVLSDSGIELVSSLLENGELPLDTRITWHFGMPLLATWENISNVAGTNGLQIVAIWSTRTGIAVATRARSVIVDSVSFEAGYAMGQMVSIDVQKHVNGDRVDRDPLMDLAQEHLSLIGALGPSSLAPSGTSHSAEPYGGGRFLDRETEIENLRRQIGLMQKRYDALANSRFGNIALKYWSVRRHGIRKYIGQWKRG